MTGDSEQVIRVRRAGALTTVQDRWTRRRTTLPIGWWAIRPLPRYWRPR
jgi:hypothetical protein